jgi:hypothetical protein
LTFGRFRRFCRTPEPEKLNYLELAKTVLKSSPTVAPAPQQPAPPCDRSDESDQSPAVPWDQAEADRLLASVLPAWNAPDRPRELNPLGGAIDDASDARDLPRLREAVAAFLAAVKPTAPATAGGAVPAVSHAAPTEAELAGIARDLERELGLPAGSLELVDPHKCNGFCRCHGETLPKREN